jgi:two-component system, NarL family, sensor histidine kinase DesK
MARRWRAIRQELVGPTPRGWLSGPGPRRWTGGALISMVWIVIAGIDLYNYYPDVGVRIVITILLVLYAAAFLLIPPVNWMVAQRFRLVLPTALWALSFTLLPFLGWQVSSLWTYVGVAAAMSMVSVRTIVGYVLVLAATSLWFGIEGHASPENLFIVPTIIASISFMMAAFAKQIQSRIQLIATQHELARVAVEQERSRVGRDMHDILGHSLTVITVKAELAGRLLETDPQRAAKEIAEVEELARGALADVRSTVAGYRGVSVVSELANARSALEAAGIRAELPGSVDDIPSAYRELFGWALREGITNVVRHSQATSCAVRLGPSFVEVSDNGRGPTEDATSSGTGLAGLRERVQDAGGSLAIGRAAGGGFLLRVSL